MTDAKRRLRSLLAVPALTAVGLYARDYIPAEAVWWLLMGFIAAVVAAYVAVWLNS